MRPSGRSYEESAKLITKLESRIRQQRHVITTLQDKRTGGNARVKAWYDGRESVLKETIREQRAVIRALESELARRAASEAMAKADKP